MWVFGMYIELLFVMFWNAMKEIQKFDLFILRMARPTFGALLLLLSVLVQGFLCKECTNTPSRLSSHTFRFELLSSKNKSWQESVFSSYKYLIPFEDSAQSSSLLINMMNELEEQTHFSAGNEFSHCTGENSPQCRESLLSDISLHKVRLDADSDYGKAQQTNLEYLLMLDVDSLVWSFRKTAGLDTPGSPYGGWEDPDTELRGHFVGHYMSASALMWSSTHNETLLYKMQAVVNALYECQQKMGTGYLSAFPSELFDRFEAIQPVWAPYYTIHKIMAGLLDQYKLATNVQAYKMVIWMANYFYNRVQNVILTYTIERHWLSLNEETGGMNDVLYSLYTLTGNKKHLLLAHLFDKPCFLGLLAIKADSMSGFHSNTHIPVVIGSQMRYEVTGDPLYKEIGLFFMDIINSSHSYASGGTSVGEIWSNPKRLGSTLGTENEESCTTYNMLKVARNLFRWTKGMAYADYYERALINGVLSIQRGDEPGVMIYMLPLGPGHSKSVSYHGWGTPFDSFWCCYGTGIESFSKLGDSIYFQEGGKYPILYVIQFISSALTWDKAGLIIKQKVKPLFSWDPYLSISLEFIKLKGSEEDNVESTVNIRIPFWTTIDGATATLNNEKLMLSGPGTFLTITRVWKTEDKLSLLLPVEIRTERIKDNRPQFASVKAILFGPYLLAGMTQRDWDLGVNNKNSFSEWITAVPNSFSSQLFSFFREVNVSNSVVRDETTLFISQSENGVLMESFPWAGTNNATSATFRIIKLVPQSRNIEFKERKVASILDFVGSEVYLEPFAFPGMLVSHNGADYPVSIINRPQYVLGDEVHCLASICSPQSADLDAIFKVLPGLDGVNSSVSFEASSLPNCFLYGTASYQVGKAVELRCKLNATDPAFNYATSFTPTAGVATYHPISFVARGTDRSYLLAPLSAFRDESYIVYFNITS